MKKFLVLASLALFVSLAVADFTEGPGDEGDDMLYPPVPHPNHHPHPAERAERPVELKKHHLRRHGKCGGKFPKLAISVGDGRPCLFVTENLDLYDTCVLDEALLPTQDFEFGYDDKKVIFRAATKLTSSKCKSADSAVCTCDNDDCEVVGYGYTQTWEELEDKSEEVTKSDRHHKKGHGRRPGGIALTYHTEETCEDGFKNVTMAYECDYEALEELHKTGETEARSLKLTHVDNADKCSTTYHVRTLAACPLRGKMWLRAMWVHLILSFLFWACCFGVCCNLCCVLPMMLCCSGRRSTRTRVRVVNLHAPAPSVATGLAPTPMYTVPQVGHAPVARPLVKDGYVQLSAQEKM